MRSAIVRVSVVFVIFPVWFLPLLRTARNVQQGQHRGLAEVSSALLHFVHTAYRVVLLRHRVRGVSFRCLEPFRSFRNICLDRATALEL